MTVLTGGQLGVQKKFVVREDAHTRGGGGGNGKVENCRRRGPGRGHRRSLTRRSRRTGTGLRLRPHGQGSSGGFFCGAMRGVAAPAIATGVKNPGHQEKHDENGRNRKPLRRRWNAVLSSGGSRGQMFRAGQVVFTEECFFIEAQIAHDGAHEAVAEDAPRQLGPIFIFQGFDKTGADARGLGELVHGNFAQLALALQPFTKISPGHEPEPVLDNPSATAKQSFTSATAERSLTTVTAKRLTRRALREGGGAKPCPTRIVVAVYVHATRRQFIVASPGRRAKYEQCGELRSRPCRRLYTAVREVPVRVFLISCRDGLGLGKFSAQKPRCRSRVSAAQHFPVFFQRDNLQCFPGHSRPRWSSGLALAAALFFGDELFHSSGDFFVREHFPAVDLRQAFFHLADKPLVVTNQTLDRFMDQ